MRRLDVTVQCRAWYKSSIMVPDDLTEEEAIQYAKGHIGEISCGELEYVENSDVLDEENCHLTPITDDIADFFARPEENITPLTEYCDSDKGRKAVVMDLVGRESLQKMLVDKYLVSATTPNAFGNEFRNYTLDFPNNYNSDKEDNSNETK